eukprot:scaffold142034_cov28-Tisochrysis_lutea.AAC.2
MKGDAGKVVRRELKQGSTTWSTREIPQSENTKSPPDRRPEMSSTGCPGMGPSSSENSSEDSEPNSSKSP